MASRKHFSIDEVGRKIKFSYPRHGNGVLVPRVGTIENVQDGAESQLVNVEDMFGHIQSFHVKKMKNARLL